MTECLNIMKSQSKRAGAPSPHHHRVVPLRTIALLLLMLGYTSSIRLDQKDHQREVGVREELPRYYKMTRRRRIRNSVARGRSHGFYVPAGVICREVIGGICD